MKYVLTFLLFAGFLASCGTSSRNVSTSTQYESSSADLSDPLMPGAAPSWRMQTSTTENIAMLKAGSTSQFALNRKVTDEPVPSNHPRKMTYSAFVVVAVDSVDSAIVSVKGVAKLFDGYVLNSSNSTVTLRVPSAKFEEAIAAIARTGTMTDKNIRGNDISDEYYDTETRLANAENARKRYLELLAKAENVEAALKVEKELERLTGEIESMKGKIARLKESTALATITVTLRTNTKTTPGPLGYIFVGLYHAVKWLFVWN